MIDEVESWREYRADLSLEEIQAFEEIEMGIARLFINNPEQLKRLRWKIRNGAAELAERNRIMSYKPQTDLPIPAGAKAMEWTYHGSGTGWWRTLSWLDYKSSSGIAIQVCGGQDESGKCSRMNIRVYDQDCSDPYAPDIQPEEARAMGEALLAAADLVESERARA